MDKRTRRSSSRRFADCGKRFLIAHLLLACMLAGGCASVHGPRMGVEGEALVETPYEPLYVAADEAETAPEPTVVEPTVVGYPEPRDPLMRLNRAIFAFNDVTYRYVLIPLSKGYLRVVPDPVRMSVSNFFYNLRAPIYLVNHLLQGKPRPAGRNLLRFGINTTLGVFGLFDPATSVFNLEREETTFEDTLIRYGSGQGVYLVLPFFGPSDTRNGVSLVVDYFLHPVPYLADDPEETVIRSADYFQEYAPTAEQYEILRRKAEDPYIFFRNLYIQGVQRDVEY